MNSLADILEYREVLAGIIFKWLPEIEQIFISAGIPYPKQLFHSKRYFYWEHIGSTPILKKVGDEYIMSFEHRRSENCIFLVMLNINEVMQYKNIINIKMK